MHNTSPSSATLWHAFAHEHATVSALVRRYQYSEKWVRTKLDAYTPPSYRPKPRQMVAVADATWIHGEWLVVIRDPHAKENVYAQVCFTESTSDYQRAQFELERLGVTFVALVGDGRVALPWAFGGVPIQMCHFHQIQIVVKYLTRNPVLLAGQELLDLAYSLPKNDKASFTDAFELWCRTHAAFLKEKTINPDTGKSTYTHRRLRSARDSIRHHLKYLFTFEDYPELNIPNTTNSLDGFFKRLKISLAVHAGLSAKHKLKLIFSLLRGVD